MKNVQCVTYTGDDRGLIRQGINGIYEVLMGTDADRKRSILFCLDWFMDPYYGQDISEFHDELIELLETVIISPNEDDVIEEAIHLLMNYEWPPFVILENNIDSIPVEFHKDVQYLLNMDKE